MNMKLHASEECMNVKLAGKVNIFSIIGFWTCTCWVSGFLKTQVGRPGVFKLGGQFPFRLSGLDLVS